MLYLSLVIFGGIAWYVSTIAAGGAATLLIPVIGFLLGAQFVAPVISIASLCTNPPRAWLFRHDINWKVLRWLLPGSLVGAFMGAWSFTQFDVAVIEVILAVFLISYVFQYKFRTVTFRVGMKSVWFLPIGLIVAFLSGLVGATGPILNPFMLHYGLEKEHLVGTKSLNSLVMQLTKLGTYTFFGSMNPDIFLYGSLLGVGAIIGVYLARQHLLNIDKKRFRSYTMIMMFCAGVLMLIKHIL